MSLENFPINSFDKIRYSDTDRQGHVNNAVFATYLETGRLALLDQAKLVVLTETTSFVLAAIKLDFVLEIKWPGRVDIGTGIRRIGNSSLTLYQEVFQHGQCVAKAESTIVQIDHQIGKGKPLEEKTKITLQKWLLT